MRKVLATIVGLSFSYALVSHGAALAGVMAGPGVGGVQGAPGAAAVLGAVDGGVAPSLALAGQGLVRPPSIEDVEEMCALLLGCPDVPLQAPRNDFGECVQALFSTMSSPDAVKFSVPLRECGMQSDSCKELRECALRGSSGDACKSRGKDKAVGFCDNDGRAVTCYKEKVVQVRDCPKYGEQCAAREGSSTCTLGACPSEVPPDGTPVCSGNGQKIFSCDKGKLISLDCSAFGLACVKDDAGKPVCAPANTPVCKKDLSRCDGAEHVGCVGGHEVKVQCDKAGMKCATSPGANTIGGCTEPALDGGSCSGPAKCNGSSIEYCVAGKQRSFFCKGLGFSKCAGKQGQVYCSQ